jgi:quercetin dioxygenase-like cupin family protein
LTSEPKPGEEQIFQGMKGTFEAKFPSIGFRQFASRECGAVGFSTGLSIFPPNSELPNHRHCCSKTVTVLRGEVHLFVEEVEHRLLYLDCVHIPKGLFHRMLNPSDQDESLVHWSFASETPSYDFMEAERNIGPPLASDDSAAVSIIRSAQAPAYELAPGTQFRDLFAGRFGSVGICGGYGEFNPGSSLPCHLHKYDESITIIKGEAICEVAGKRYLLSDCDTGFVPQGRPHRFLNESLDVMAMIWVYAGSEPERTIVDTGYCTGHLKCDRSLVADWIENG